jgi:predicted Zn-dependent protease
MHRLQGLVFADDPRQGYTIGRTYYHPVLAFKIDFPDQWRIINQRQAVGALNENKDAALVLTLSDESSPRAAFDAFFAQQGTEKGPERGHNTFAFRSYDTQTGVREAEGMVRFLSHGGRVYQILGYTGVNGWGNYGAAMERSLASFAEVTESRYLDVKPKTIDVVELSQDMTLTQFANRYPFFCAGSRGMWGRPSTLPSAGRARRVV